MKVMVTGGAGFLGAHLMAKLQAAGHTVIAYDLIPPSPQIRSVAPMLDVALRHGSIENLDELLRVCRTENIEALVHTAARVGIAASLSDPVGFYRTNVIGTMHVCEAARLLHMSKLIYVSSNAVYCGAAGGKLKETDLPFSVTRGNPAAHYGTSKMAGEAIGMAYAEFHDVDFLALRVTAIYGFGMNAAVLVKPLVENAVAGKPTRLPDGGRTRRDYTYVLDCCEAITAALHAPKRAKGSQRIINAAAGRLYSGYEVADIVRKVIPGAVIELGPELSAIEEANVKVRAPLDITTAQELISWIPRWQLEEGIADYAERLRAHSERPQ